MSRKELSLPSESQSERGVWEYGVMGLWGYGGMGVWGYGGMGGLDGIGEAF